MARVPKGVRALSLDLIDFDDGAYLARTDFRLSDLLASVGERGVLAPILVEPEGDTFRIIDGFRRVAAAHHAGLWSIPARIISSGEPGHHLLTAWLRNRKSRTYSTLESATLLEKLARWWSDSDLLHSTGLSRRQVDRLMLLARAPAFVHDAIEVRGLSATAASQLIDELNRSKRQHELRRWVEYACVEALSGRALIAVVRQSSPAPLGPESRLFVTPRVALEAVPTSPDLFLRFRHARTPTPLTRDAVDAMIEDLRNLGRLLGERLLNPAVRLRISAPLNRPFEVANVVDEAETLVDPAGGKVIPLYVQRRD